METQVRDERRAYRKDVFRELLASEGWQQVLKPALLARMELISRKLATTNAGVEEMRREQGRYKELSWLLGLTVDQMHQLDED